MSLRGQGEANQECKRVGEAPWRTGSVIELRYRTSMLSEIPVENNDSAGEVHLGAA